MRPLLFRMATEMAKLRDSEISRCSICGASVVWAHRPDPTTGEPTTSWHPPLEFAHFSYTVVNDAVFKVPVYNKHTCDPKNIKTYEAEKKQRAAAREAAALQRASARPSTEREQHTAEMLDFMAEVSADTPCARCEALAGSPCRDLRKRRDKTVRMKKWPHDERVAAFLREHPERSLPEMPPTGADDATADTTGAA